MSKKTVFFLSLFIIGIVTFILTIFTFRIEETLGLSLTIAAVIFILGGIIGCCFTSKSLRGIFGGLLDIIFELF